LSSNNFEQVLYRASEAKALYKCKNNLQVLSDWQVKMTFD